MKIKRQTAFNARKVSKRAFVSKVFLAFEGEKTESNYFSFLLKHCRQNAAYDFVFLERPESNPKIIIDTIVDSLNSKSIAPSASFVFDEFMKQFSYDDSKKENEAKKSFRPKFESWLAKRSLSFAGEIPDNQMTDVVQYLCSEVDGFKNQELFRQHLVHYRDYNEDVDKIFLVVDRDSGSFTCEQCDYVIKKSVENKINLVISNPCIEFYFLLHHNDCSSYNIDDIRKNKKVDKKKTFVLKELQRLDPKYGKKLVDFSFYLKNYSFAKGNSSKYATDVIELKDNVGTNIFSLADLFINS